MGYFSGKPQTKKDSTIQIIANETNENDSDVPSKE